MTSLAHILARGDVWTGAAAAAALPVVASGFAALDAELPGGGWPAGLLTELLPEHEGIGELRLLGPALSRIAAGGRCLAWIGPPHIPYAPALSAAGIALGRVMVVRTRTPRDSLWAAEQALRSRACGAVLVWPERIAYAELKRLAWAAEGSRALALLFRPPVAAREPSPAVLRVGVHTLNGGIAVRLLKRRGNPLERPILLDAAPAFCRPGRPFHVVAGALPPPAAPRSGPRLAFG